MIAFNLTFFLPNKHMQKWSNYVQQAGMQELRNGNTHNYNATPATFCLHSCHKNYVNAWSLILAAMHGHYNSVIGSHCIIETILFLLTCLCVAFRSLRG